MSEPNHHSSLGPTAWNTSLPLVYLSGSAEQNHTRSVRSSDTNSTIPLRRHPTHTDTLGSDPSSCAYDRQDDHQVSLWATNVFSPSGCNMDMELAGLGEHFLSRQQPYPTILPALEPHGAPRSGQQDKSTTVTCAICGNHFKTRSSLGKHIRSIHGAKKKFKCTHKTSEATDGTCTATFTLQKDLRRHLDTVHNGEKPGAFKCNICGTTCNRKDNFDRHIKKHHPESLLTTN